MGKLNKKLAMNMAILGLGTSSLSAAIFASNTGIYDMRPKNHFRGGSIGKGGKIKYRRG